MPDVLLAAVAAALGLVAGALIARLRRRGPDHVPPPPPSAGLPVEALDVLRALRSTVIVVDRAERPVFASPAATALGLVREDRVRSDALLLMTREVQRGAVLRTAELQLPRGPLGGQSVPVNVRVTPLGADHVLVLVDVDAEPRRLDAVRRDFVANTSHELKTPVGAILLLSEAVLDAADDLDAVRRFATRLQTEASRLSNLVNELIQLSRLQDRDPLLQSTDVDVDDLVSDALDRCRYAAEQRGISLVYGGDSDLWVHGDEEQLVTALRNLVTNAINYSAERTRVAVGVRRCADLVEISVTDQGIGIAPADQPRIFERFYRADPARSRATGGTGLGLAIVKHVAELHGGEVTVWSVPGEGSTFTLRLPVAAGTDRAATMIPAPILRPEEAR